MNKLDNKLDNLLTLEDLAKKLKVNKRAIYKFTRETGPGAIPKLRVGKRLYFEPDAVFKWMDGKTRST